MAFEKMSDEAIALARLEAKRLSEVLDVDNPGVECDQILFDRLVRAITDSQQKYKYDGGRLYLFRMNSDLKTKFIKSSDSHPEIIEYTGDLLEKADQQLCSRASRSKANATENENFRKTVTSTIETVNKFLRERRLDQAVPAQITKPAPVFNQDDSSSWQGLSADDTRSSKEALQEKISERSKKVKNNFSLIKELEKEKQPFQVRITTLEPQLEDAQDEETYSKNEAPRSRAAKYQRGLKSHFVLEGDTSFPLPN